MQGSRSWLAFGERNKIPFRFRRARICKFLRQKHRFFTIEGKQAICGCPKALWKLFTAGSSKVLWNILESRLFESFLKILRKQALRKLYESSLKAGSPKALWTFSESRLSKRSLKALRKLSKSFLKAGWLLLKALQKQADFHWKLSETRMTFVESSTKAGRLSLSALRKQDDFHWGLYESRMTFITKAGVFLLRGLWKQVDFCLELYSSLSKSA